MTAIDGTGLHAIEQLHKKLHASGRTLLLCGLRNQPLHFIEKTNLPKLVGPKNILPNIGFTLQRASEIYDNFGGIGEEAAAGLANAAV